MLRRMVAVIAVSVLHTAPSVSAQDIESFPGVELGLEYGTGRRDVLAIPPIDPGRGGATQVAEIIHDILANDFDFSDTFTVLDRLPAVSGGFDVDYTFWDQQNADWLLIGRIEPSGSLYLELHDVVFNRVHYAAVFPLGSPDSEFFRMRVHVAHDQLFEEITGQIGIAASRIAFSIREDDGRQEIWVIDSDGENLTRLTDHATGVAPGEPPPISQSPAWSSDGLRIVYHSTMSPSGNYRIRERILATGQDEVIQVGRGGQFYTPAYLPDGRIVFSGYFGQQSAILAYDVRRDCCLESLATGRIEISLSPSADGRSIAWESARLGPSQIFTRALGGNGSARILSPYRSNGNAFHAPDWSPDGRLMAFHGELSPGVNQIVIGSVGRRSGPFTLITDSEGRNESNEDPSWAPDSRHIAFVGTRRDGIGLYVVDTVTGRTRRLLGGRRINVPAWSPAVRAGGEEN